MSSTFQINSESFTNEINRAMNNAIEEIVWKIADEYIEEKVKEFQTQLLEKRNDIVVRVMTQAQSFINQWWNWVDFTIRMKPF